jgi:von Willebrand factor type A C-terminal domain/von Willebrand factor type A domain
VTTFTAETYQNEYLPDGGTEVNAIITVTATATASAGDATVGSVGAPEAVELILLDCSGSMEQPHAKILAARQATCAAVDSLREGVWFGVIHGTGGADMIYPPDGNLVPASAMTKQAAKTAVGRVIPGGGTAIGHWLSLARDLFATRPGAIHHAILLTDGKNESQEPEEFAAQLAACEGQFQCDCRGVGTNWVVEELRSVATTLLGTVDIIPDPATMETDFRVMIESAMGKAVRQVALRVWTPQGAAVQFVKQVAPTIEDLTARAQPVNALTSDYPTGAWGNESRDYHVCVSVKAGPVGAEMLAGRISLVVGDDAVSQALVKAVWTEDAALSTQINNHVAHYTGQAELAQVIQEGLEARKAGDDETATMKLGRAVQLANASGNVETTKLLAKVVTVDDPETGTVRLRLDVEAADEMALDTRSTKTTRVK